MKTIYKITNIINNRVYIGQTKQYSIRQRQHMNDLKSNRHSNTYLQEDYNKQSPSDFVFMIIEIVDDNISNEREDYWMSYYGGIDSQMIYNGMNSVTKAICMKQKLHNFYAGKSHVELHGKEKAEQMRLKNSQKHLGKQPCYVPNKGKVMGTDNQLHIVTEDLYNRVHKLKQDGIPIVKIIDIVGIKYSGVHHILNNSLYLPFKCND